MRYAHAILLVLALSACIETRPREESEPAASPLAEARRALAEGDRVLLRQMGVAAVPALCEAVRAAPDSMPIEIGGDPFFLLLSSDPIVASELCDELADEQGFFWKRRVLRALGQVGGFQWERLWSAGSLLTPGLLRQYEKVVADPGMTAEAIRWIEPILSDESLTPGLRATFLAALASEDRNLRAEAWKVAQPSVGMEAFYRELLASPDAEVRTLAVGRLAELNDESAAFFACARDSEINVRRAVARRLRRGLPAWTPAALSALELLLVDADSSARRDALGVFKDDQFGPWVSDSETGRSLFALAPSRATLQRIAVSADPEDRVALARKVLTKMSAEVAVPLFEQLARDADKYVVQAVLESVGSLRLETPEECLRVAGIALAHPALDRFRALETATKLVANLVSRESTRCLAMRWAFDQREPALTRVCKLANVGTLPIDWLPPELLGDYCRRMFVAEARDLVFLCESKAVRFEPAQLEALVALASDPGEPAGLRFLAALAPLNAARPGAEFGAALRALFAEEWWESVPQAVWAHAPSRSLERMPGELANACLLALARAPDVPPAVLKPLLEKIDLSSSGARELLLFLLESRFGHEEPEQRLIADLALTHMGRDPAQAEREWLERGARHGDHERAALVAIGELGDPVYLPLLDEKIRTGAVATVERAADALSGYSSDEAGELLLVAATRLSGAALDRAVAHLARIRAYRDAREQWAAHRASQQTRMQVIAELVAKLDAPPEEVQIEAIRALTTWEAVEAMPRLIELTQSSSKKVADAARAALEHLNTLKRSPPPSPYSHLLMR